MTENNILDEINKQFMGSSGPPAIKFATRGDGFKGQIIKVDQRQGRNPKTNEPLTWPDGKPKMDIILTLKCSSLKQTVEITETTADGGVRVVRESRKIDLSNDEHESKRRLFLRGNLFTQMRESVSKSGAPGLEYGAIVGGAYVADGERTNPAFDPPKLFQTSYERPTVPFTPEPDEAGPFDQGGAQQPTMDALADFD